MLNISNIKYADANIFKNMQLLLMSHQNITSIYKTVMTLTLSLGIIRSTQLCNKTLDQKSIKSPLSVSPGDLKGAGMAYK